MLERSAPKVYEYGVHKGDNEYGTLGTDPLNGFDFSTTYFYNMGEKFIYCGLPLLNIA